MSEAVLCPHAVPVFMRHRLPSFLPSSDPTHPHRRVYFVAARPAALQCDGCCIAGYECQEMSNSYSEVRHCEARKSYNGLLQATARKLVHGALISLLFVLALVYMLHERSGRALKQRAAHTKYKRKKARMGWRSRKIISVVSTIGN